MKTTKTFILTIALLAVCGSASSYSFAGTAPSPDGKKIDPHVCCRIPLPPPPPPPPASSNAIAIVSFLASLLPL